MLITLTLIFQQIFDFTIDSEHSIPETTIEDICKKVLRYSVKTGHSHFHNQLFAGMDPYGLAGSWITDALNTSQYTYEVAPIFSLIEDFVIKKCLSLFGLENGDGIFSPGGSISNFYGMVLARYMKYPKIKETGLFGLPRLVAFTSDDVNYMTYQQLGIIIYLIIIYFVNKGSLQYEEISPLAWYGNR